MVNYYVELNLDRGMDNDGLKEQLSKMRRKWQSRANSATTLEARQDAEKKMQMIREASAILLVPEEREKYDQKLDENPVFSGQTPDVPEDTTPAPDASFLDTATAMDAIEVAYSSAKYNTLNTLAKALIDRKEANERVYCLLALSYIETDDLNNATSTIQDMIQAMPESIDARYWAAFYNLRLLSNRAEEARKHIDWLLQSDEGASARVAALDVEYHIDTGDLDLAAAKTESYRQSVGHDKAFTRGVGEAYRQYAESNYTSYGGDCYFDDKQSYENWMKYTQLALDIYPDKDIQELFQDNKKIVSGYSFIKSNLTGVLFALILGFIWANGGPKDNSTFLLGFIFILVGIYIAVFSFPPKWMVHRSLYTGKLDPLYEIAKIASNLVNKIFRGFIWLFKAFIRLILSFF